MSAIRDRWVILLAGGEGRRLLGHTVLGTAIDRPKQFCRFGGERSLLESAVERALRVVEPERVVLVVCSPQRAWWMHELRRLPPVQVVEQPENRGNAAAILHAVFHVLEQDPDPSIAILPCDHAVEEEDVLEDALLDAWRSSARNRRLTLLGITPEAPEVSYGWIVPGREPGPLRSVRAFIEKPSRPTAAALIRHGALWNSFILTGTGAGIVDLFRRTQPRFLGACLENLFERGHGLASLSALYRSLEPLDFSRDVLEHAAAWLDVLPVPSCGWTDLGTPERVDRWLVRRGLELPRGGELVPINGW